MTTDQKIFNFNHNRSDLEKHFIEKLNAKRFFKNILKLLKNGRHFGVTLRHYQVKTVKVQTRIYKT